MRRKLFLALISVVFAGVANSVAPTTVRADVHDPPWVDVFGSEWGDLNTTGAAQDFVSSFTAGYTKFTDLNKSAATAMSLAYAQSDAIWITFGHGGGGFITYCNPPRGATCTTVVRSNVSCGASDGVCMSDYGTSIHKIKLMVFAGCETALTPVGGRTLSNQAVNYNGVDSTLAFQDLIYFGGFDAPDHYWATSFAYRLSVGDSVNSAASIAAQNVVVHSFFGDDYGWYSYIAFHGGTVVLPPAYGS